MIDSRRRDNAVPSYASYNAAALILNRLRCDTDGPETAHTRVLLYADDTHIKLTLWNRALALTPGKRYRVTIEEVE